jgi:hypothetical protein
VIAGRHVVAVIALLFIPALACAQVNGHVSVMFDALPDVSEATGSQQVMELRTRLFLEHKRDVGSHIRLNLSAYADGLAGDRSGAGAPGTTTDALLRPNEFYAEFVATHFDLRVGASRIVWGRLDEFQPTDVVNPIDLTRFVLEGRSEARLPVGLVRARAFLPGASTLEGVLVPVFRAGRFDQLDERTSPFNLGPTGNLDRQDPDPNWRNLQGGARFTSTAARVDWGVSAFRGFSTFPRYALGLTQIVELFPRFTMVGGDFETVRGRWGLRGEGAAFVEHGRVDRVESGAGADRRAGDYRIAGNVLVTHQRNHNGTDVTLVAVADRSFARETRTVRVLGVYNPTDDTGFVRAIGSISLKDDVWLEGSVGAFMGSSTDTLGLLTRRDFVYTGLKVFF